MNFHLHSLTFSSKKTQEQDLTNKELDLQQAWLMQMQVKEQFADTSTSWKTHTSYAR